jgi:hypothetical protein
MKKQFLLITLAIISTGAFTQNLQWAKRIGGTSFEYSASIAVDDSGNVYTTGDFNGTVDFDPGTGIFNLTSSGLEDIFILKTDASGNFLWAKRMGGTADDRGFSIAPDDSGNIYCTGYFSGTADFDPGSASYNLTSGGGVDVFIVKLNASGNLVWAKSMGGSSDQWGLSLTVSDSGNVYTTGFFKGTDIDFDPGTGTFLLSSLSFSTRDIFISKLNSSGNFVWAKRIGGGEDDEGSSIAVDAAENIYTTGYFTGSADFDPGPGNYFLYSSGLNGIFISKLNASGNFVWAKQIGGSNFIGDGNGKSIALDDSGNVYLTGDFDATMDFDPGAGTYNLTALGSLGEEDIFITKLDSAGNFVWAKRMGGINSDFGYGIAVDKNGYVYTTGCFIGTVDFDPGPATYNLTSDGFDLFDIFVSKLNSSGNFIWAKRMGGPNSDYGIAIALDKLENVYTTGQFQNTVDFDPDSGTYNLTSAGGIDIFMSKLGPCTAAAGPITGPSSACPGSTQNYFISAVKGATGYVWTVPPGTIINSGQNTLTINITFATFSGNVTVTPENSCGSGSPDSIMVTLKLQPMITDQPGDQTTSIGSVAKFITASSSPVTYQWQQNSGSGFVDLSDTGQYSGVTHDTLIITAVTLAQDNYKYRSTITGVSCSINTNVAVLTIKNNIGINAFINEKSFVIFPNPANEIITILADISPVNFTYCITDAMGKNVLSGMLYKKTTPVDISILAPGFYYVSITDSITHQGNSETFKLVKTMK